MRAREHEKTGAPLWRSTLSMCRPELNRSYRTWEMWGSVGKGSFWFGWPTYAVCFSHLSSTQLTPTGFSLRARSSLTGLFQRAQGINTSSCTMPQLFRLLCFDDKPVMIFDCHQFNQLGKQTAHYNIFIQIKAWRNEIISEKKQTNLDFSPVIRPFGWHLH